MLSEAPPSREEVTTSRTCAELVEVKTFTSSGMIAPASVPQVITVDSFHHSEVSPPSCRNQQVAQHVGQRHETIEVSQTRLVSGASKSIFSAFL
jgi:hypothetical protein